MTGSDRSTLEAYADGALSPEEARAVERRLAENPEDRAVVEGLVKMRGLLAAAYDAPMREPAPAAMRAAIAKAMKPAPPRRRRLAPAIAALAASVGLAVGLALGLLAPRDGAAPEVVLAGPVAEGSTLHALLQTAPSGQGAALAGVGDATLMATFLDAAGRACREIEATAAAAAFVTRMVACHDPSGWTVEIAVAEPAAPAPMERDGFVPASGAADAALGVALDRLGAGTVLGPDEEARLIGQGWGRP
jgi:anti-sigma factor RsiW